MLVCMNPVHNQHRIHTNTNCFSNNARIDALTPTHSALRILICLGISLPYLIIFTFARVCLRYTSSMSVRDASKADSHLRASYIPNYSASPAATLSSHAAIAAESCPPYVLESISLPLSKIAGVPTFFIFSRNASSVLAL